MNQQPLDSSLQALNLALIVANIIVYFTFFGLAGAWNRFSRKEVLKKRIVGSVGVVLFSAIAAWFARTNLVNEQLLSSLPPFKQGEYLGQITGVVLFPAIVVLSVVAIRGWLAQRKRNASTGT